ncbi:MAG TPA: peptidase S1, partial [Terriglobia bacterium]|nr:peptidase S1 [Terriglobia bacterium]
MQSDARRYAVVLALVVALGFGIAIGAYFARGSRAVPSAGTSADPHPLAEPSPAELSTSFARIAEQMEPAVVNINTETTV